MGTRNGRPFYGWKRFVRCRLEVARGRAVRRERQGRASIAPLLGIPEETVRKGLEIYRSAGIEVLAMTERRRAAYSFEADPGGVLESVPMCGAGR